jgi:hypothetical protein
MLCVFENFIRFGSLRRPETENMLWTIFVVLLVLWLLGFSLHIGGALIHLLLVVGLAVLVINLLNGRRTAVCARDRGRDVIGAARGFKEAVL